MSLPPSLQSWSLPRLSALLPLDEPSLLQLLTYTISLPPEEAAEHLKNILGDSAKALEFIVGFNERRGGGTKQGKGTGKNNGGGAGGGGRGGDTQQKQPPSASGPLISEYMPNVRAKAARAGKQRAAHQQQQQSPSRTQTQTQPRTSRSGSNTPTTTTTTTNNITDLTSAIAMLELSTNPSTTSTPNKPRKCTCSASLHPLFTPAPNCLSCGKIICALEGLQPCSFCQTPLLSNGEVQEIIRELRAERGNEKMRAHNNNSASRAGTTTPFEQSLDRNAGSSSNTNTRTATLDAAKAHRDKLLSFQAQNARRTKVVDEVAEFETVDDHVGATRWMSVGERALALKRQQRVMREMEERSRPEWEKERERGVVVISLGGAGGKGKGKGVVRRVERVGVGKEENEGGDKGEDQGEEEVVEGEGEKEREGAFGNNPLLAGGGLVRPVWKAEGDKDGAGTRKREQKQTWRRVQDDNSEDNERWILDGGLYGYGREGDVEGDGNFCG
ncbi:hypothetical protein FQN50_005284 [Emmonsiellopsis sp. PD_5]|nr:hypothetical protein FQN50_005284 [Emmonsiellopsis sp. PD_5]